MTLEEARILYFRWSSLMKGEDWADVSALINQMIKALKVQELQFEVDRNTVDELMKLKYKRTGLELALHVVQYQLEESKAIFERLEGEEK